MLIILEGCDGVGKTTLAREISALLPDARTLHAVQLDWGVHPLTAYEAPLRDYRAGIGKDIICDRWHVGEAVYPQVLKRPTRWNIAVERHLRMFMRARGALVVLLTAFEDELRTRLHARGDDVVDDTMLEDIHAEYIKAYDRDNFTCLMKSNVITPKQIVGEAECAEEGARMLRPFETYVGSTEPKVLLYGDTRGVGGMFVHQRMPAFMPYPGTSGHYL